MPELDMTNMPVSHFKMPEGLGDEDQLMLAIGRLISEWATCESLIWGLFYSLTETPRGGTSSILWLSTRGTSARITLVQRLAASANLPDELHSELKAAIEKFADITKTRNFFCHAWYAADRETMALKQIESHRLKGDSAVIDRELFSASTIEKTVSSTREAEDLSQRLWKVVHDVRVVLGLPNGSFVLQHAGA